MSTFLLDPDDSAPVKRDTESQSAGPPGGDGRPALHWAPMTPWGWGEGSRDTLTLTLPPPSARLAGGSDSGPRGWRGVGGRGFLLVSGEYYQRGQSFTL